MGFFRGVATVGRAVAVGLGLALLGVAMVAMWGVSAASNVAHAYQIAGHSEYAHVWAVASLAADVLKIGAVASIMAAYHHRLKVALCLSLVVWGTMTLWSVKSSIGFSSTVLTEKAAVRETDGSIKKSVQAELDQLVQQQGMLRGQTTTVARGANAEERERVRDAQKLALAEAKRMEERISYLRAELRRQSGVVVAHAGASSDPIAQYFAPAGAQQWQIDLATILFMLLMVELGGNLTTAAFGHLYFKRPLRAPPLRPEPAPEPKAELMDALFAPRPSRLDALQAAHQTSRAIASRDVEAELAKIQARRAGRAISPTLRGQAEVYLSDIVEVFGAGTVAIGKDVLDLFDAWAQREGITAPLKRNQLAQQLMCCKVIRIDGGGYRLPEA